ncbi:Ig-like domain-containing protein [Angustibacter sp. Root456]|uniref:L,D-transpeptidase n=1 Tax=Angustibacter sp. Root456 TaxID=1736539 RepID=UPI000A6FC197|nr:Ig-like domain-containing protein [Angustibacter sp. Root456]
MRQTNQAPSQNRPASGRLARRALVWSSLVAAAAIAIAGCQSSTPQAAAHDRPSVTSPSTPAVEPASLTISPTDGSTSVRPDATITVSADGGTLQDVSVRSGDGAAVEGTLNDAKTTWTAKGGLRPSATYQVSASAVNEAGEATSQTATLTTLKPRDTATYGIIPSGSTPVGVGMPVAIQFVTPVDADTRAAVERRVSVTSTPAMKGAWGWLDGRQLIWRPATYWKPGTKVTVKANIAGIETHNGLWTDHDASSTFTIGDAMVSTVNTKTHRMTVTRNGKVLRVLKVSTGRPGSDTETRNGIKVILSRESQHTMDSATIGIKKGEKGYYNIDTKWAMRLTWSGEFLHSAPWSVGAQGNANVSHGCTNLAPADAKWLFDHSRMGDVVKFVGSTRKLEEYNGYTMWNETLAQWAKHSAL